MHRSRFYEEKEACVFEGPDVFPSHFWLSLYLLVFILFLQMKDALAPAQLWPVSSFDLLHQSVACGLLERQRVIRTQELMAKRFFFIKKKDSHVWSFFLLPRVAFCIFFFRYRQWNTELKMSHREKMLSQRNKCNPLRCQGVVFLEVFCSDLARFLLLIL